MSRISLRTAEAEKCLIPLPGERKRAVIRGGLGTMVAMEWTWRFRARNKGLDMATLFGGGVDITDGYGIRVPVVGTVDIQEAIAVAIAVTVIGYRAVVVCWCWAESGNNGKNRKQEKMLESVEG